ncbi:MAG TPA: 6,7-dimethyl-8-ribityllumazine synthase [Candidatus Nanoarchaeia archaeon]|nr:6,7-dimethyl-8-ribityllumazine synthase [Candidatus Nanoarchaeia archaeon]
MNLAIVVSQWYWEEITRRMLDLAVQTAEKNGVTTEILKVPGCYDIPLAVKKLLKRKDIDGVVTLGAIVQGDTDHDRAIAYSIFPALTQLSLEFNKPVALGITGPRMTMAQAVQRIPKAKLVMSACIEMVKTLK